MCLTHSTCSTSVKDCYELIKGLPDTLNVLHLFMGETLNCTAGVPNPRATDWYWPVAREELGHAQLEVSGG